MDLGDTFLQLGIALGLGLLVGLQRERKEGDIAGFRTFPLVTLTGALCGLLGLTFGGWVLAGGFLAVAAVVFVGNLAKIHAGKPEPGVTTEVTVLLMFAVGAFLTIGPPPVAVAVGGATAALLQLKQELHAFATRLDESELRAVMQFVVISLVVLPILPDRFYGPYDVLNPRQIWWMVVLIVALSLAGYVGYKFLGARVGTLLGGSLGGLVSSAATTVTFARREGRRQIGEHAAAQVVLIATAMVYLRVLIEIGVVSRELLAKAAPPLLVMLLLFATLALIGARLYGADEHQPAPQTNPTELRTAVFFAAFYAVVLLAVAFAKVRLGSPGLFTVAGLSGLVDMNAITLSTAQLAHAGEVGMDEAWRLVLFASLANLVFKLGVVGVLGSRALLRRMLMLWGVGLVVGAALLACWPGAGALVTW